MEIISNPDVKTKFDNYPVPFREKLWHLRNLIIEVASEMEVVQKIEETLKWGEPSYLVKKGSTIRVAWSKKKPEQYAMYFKCTSKLVETFRVLYSDCFIFENNRAIVFKLEDNVPERELRHCIELALNYHNVKHLPNLGAK